MRFRLALLAAFAVALSGCSTVMNQVGTLAARAMTGSTGDLAEVNAIVTYTDRAVPTESGEASVRAIRGWQGGQPLVSTTLFKRTGIGLLNLDGTVTLDGTELPRTFPGSYSRFFDAPPAGPLTLSFASATGQSESHTVAPRPAVRIVRINGQEPAGATISLNEPLVLELDRSATDAADLRIALLGSTMGVQGFWNVAVVGAAARVELPASVWTHTQGNPINRGDNWLKVEEYVRPVAEATASGGQAMTVAYASDYANVTVTGERDDNLVGIASREGARLTGTAEAGGRAVQWTAIKPVAFQSPPLGHARRLALVALNVTATGLRQTSTSTSERTDYAAGTRTVTTTTRTRQFAQLPDALWQSLLVDTFNGMSARMAPAIDATLIPVADVVAASAYQRFPAPEDANSARFVRHSYGGLRDLDALSFTSLFVDASGPFSAARLDNLMRELDVDGLVVAELSLAMPDDEFSLTPTLTFRILAPTTDPMQPIAASYLDVTVTGQGQEVTNEMLEDPAALGRFLPTAVNLDALLDGFGQAVSEVAAYEASAPVYEAVWTAAPRSPRR